ncbi:MAG: AraC family transcriptional regulator [Gammaproteobacteria bacterium]|jgi:AraC family transcriptional regulator
MKEYAKRILKVLTYIEDHIQDEMTIAELAQAACYSDFHFQRVFRFIVGESVHQYVRRLRLEKAMGKLRYGSQSITDIALDANFETQSAFAKAFKQCVGASPRSYRLLYKELNMIENKFSDLPMIQPDEIKNVPDIPILFIRRTGNYDISAHDAWDAMKAFIKKNHLNEKRRYISIGHDDPKITEDEKIRFDACIEDDQNIQITGEIARKIIPGGKYAIFTHQGSHEQIANTYDRIFLKWLPDSKENFDKKRFCFMEHIGETEKIYVPLA